MKTLIAALAFWCLAFLTCLTASVFILNSGWVLSELTTMLLWIACLWFASEISDGWRDVQATRRERWYTQWRAARRLERLWGDTMIRAGISADALFREMKRRIAEMLRP